MFSAIIGGLIIYIIGETVKGDIKEVWQMIDKEYKEEEQLKNEWNELKEKYFKRITS